MNNTFDTESIEFERRRRPKKKPKKRIGRIIIALFLVLALFIGSGYAVVKLFFDKPEEIVEPSTTVVIEEPQNTTFQQAIDAEYAAVSPGFWGGYEELDLVARYFAINFFTLWNVENNNDYHGKDLVPTAYFDAFDKNVKNNLLFRYPTMLDMYGLKNMPIVSGAWIDHEESFGTDVYCGNDWCTAYELPIYIDYQTNTLDGTRYEDPTKAAEFLPNWIRQVVVTFYWEPHEEGGGSWKIGEMKRMVSNADAWHELVWIDETEETNATE